MASTRTKRMLINFGMLLGPVGVLKLAALWFSPAPTGGAVEASGAATAPPSGPAAVTGAALSPEVIKRRSAAAAYAGSMRTQRFTATPFYYEPVQAQQIGPVEQTDEPVVTPALPGVPTFTVQVIMASETETKALIDGKIYRVGDEFKSGWIVADINGFARTVTIADPATNRTSTQAVRMPGERN